MPSRRAGLLLLAATNLVVGAWAQFLPLSFHRSFPLGRGWVAADGPFNEHLVRDVGGLNLALLVVVVAAAVRPRPELVRIAAVATLVSAVPHFAYHSENLSPLPAADAVAVVATLLVPVAIGFRLLLPVTPARDRATGTPPASTGPAPADTGQGRP